MRRLIDRFAVRFADAAGTEVAFAACFIIFLAWLGMMPLLGVSHWNATVGLGGNTTESTAELFLEIAILLKANRIARKQDVHGAVLATHAARLAEHSAGGGTPNAHAILGEVEARLAHHHDRLMADVRRVLEERG